MRYGIGDFLFLLLLLQPPAKEPLPLFGYRIGVGLNAGPVLGHQAIHLLLDLPAFFRLALLQLVQRFLLHALEGVQGAVAAHGVLDNFLQLDSGGVQSQQDRAAFYLGRQVKRSSILLALDAAGVKLQEIIEDAVRRDRALDTFERVQQKALDELEQRKTEESRQIQEEMDRLVTEHRARIQANADAVAKERERFFSWRLQKQQEEQKIADTVSHFVSENPITRGVPT